MSRCSRESRRSSRRNERLASVARSPMSAPTPTPTSSLAQAHQLPPGSPTRRTSQPQPLPRPQPADAYATRRQSDVPFGRVSVTGIHTTGVPFDELVCAAASLVEALSLRRQYMELSGQSITQEVVNYLSNKSQLYHNSERESKDMDSRMLRVDSDLAEQYLRATNSRSSEELLKPFESLNGKRLSETSLQNMRGGTVTVAQASVRAASASVDSGEDYLEPIIPGCQVEPWAVTHPASRGYSLRWKDGLARLYRTEADAEQDRPLPYRQVLLLLSYVDRVAGIE